MKYHIYVIAIICFVSCESKVIQKENTKAAPEIKKVTTVDTASIVTTALEKMKVIAPKGNQLFDQSVKLRYLRLSGYTLKNVEIEYCDESGEEDPNDYDNIKSITSEDNIFTIEFTVVDNCCSEFLCEAELINETTLNIIYHAFGRHCSCNCTFLLKYTFERNGLLERIGEKHIPITHVQINDYEDSKVKFEY